MGSGVVYVVVDMKLNRAYSVPLGRGFASILRGLKLVMCGFLSPITAEQDVNYRFGVTCGGEGERC